MYTCVHVALFQISRTLKKDVAVAQDIPYTYGMSHTRMGFPYAYGTKYAYGVEQLYMFVLYLEIIYVQEYRLDAYLK